MLRRRRKIYGACAGNDTKTVHLGYPTCDVFQDHFNPLDSIR